MMRKAVATALVTAALAAEVAYAGTGPDGTTYVLTSYDGVSLLALNDQGSTLTGNLGSETSYRQAQLDKYSPNDPYKAACGQAAANYNAGLIVATSDGGFALQAAISKLATLACKAKVVLDNKTVPPNPIKTFQPVP